MQEGLEGRSLAIQWPGSPIEAIKLIYCRYYYWLFMFIAEPVCPLGLRDPYLRA